MTSEAFTLPAHNEQVANCLYAVEVGLRELIIRELELAVGPQWFKRRVPEMVRTEALSRYYEERKLKWTSFIPLHPIYYTNFGELKQIIDRNDNWKVLSRFFQRREVVMGTLAELDPIRNKIAHNRPATLSDVKVATSSLEKLSNSIGRTEFAQLVQSCTNAAGIVDILRDTIDEFVNVREKMKRYLEVSIETLASSLDPWWFDDEYLHKDLGPIRACIQLASEYCTIPGGRGLGHLREQWMAHSNANLAFVEAERCIEEIINEASV